MKHVMRSFLPGIWSNSECSPKSHLEFDLLQLACLGLLKPNPMVMLWESTFITQVCATRSYRHPASRTGLND